jgi:hypothetical protein
MAGDLATWTIVADFWIAALFVPVVSLFWRWWRSRLGRVLMSLEFLIAALLFLPALSVMFDLPVRADVFLWVTWAILALVGVRILWLWWILFRIQRGEDPAQEPQPEGTPHGGQRTGN